jgi:solute carrier family 5 (high affinity choline transporter), member 7
MGQIFWGGVAAVVVMYAAFLVVGWLAARKVHEGTPADLIVAGRSMPLWIATLTMTATWVDGGYLLGTAEGTFANLASGIQGGLCFGISLILGGLFFAKTMRQYEFTTLIDPFEARFGKRWAAVLFVPAMLGEVIWSASLLVAIGATFGVILAMPMESAILMSAVVVTAYTMVGGMWSVAYTDAFQLVLIPIGLLAALPFAMDKVGGLDACLHRYAEKHIAQGQPEAVRPLPPLGTAAGYWTPQRSAAWWDLSAMLILGGIPWNCYFQRVLSCQTPAKAAWHSLLAGVLTISLVIPPLLLGMAAFSYNGWPETIQKDLDVNPALALPLLLHHMTPAIISILGLAAIIGAVTSSFSSSILSAGSMFSWNVFRTLLVPDASVGEMKRIIRGSILFLGVGAVVLALTVGSVQKLWFFCADLVFVLLLPQLVMALFDPKANRIGSVTAFTVSLILRLGGGEPIFGLPAFIPYPEIAQNWLSGTPESWYDNTGATLFPFRVTAALAGLILLPLVSRLTARWDPPRPLRRTDN